MREITKTSLTGVEPQTLKLSSDLSKEAKESIADVPRLVIENISHQTSFWREKDRVLQNRDLYRLFFDHESTTPHKGQVPEQPTRMQEKRKATFVTRAPINESLSSAPDPHALPATGTWPKLTTNRPYVNRSLHQEGEIRSIFEV